MKFVLNGDSHETNAPLTVASLLDELDIRKRRVAVAINTEVVPRSRFQQAEIRDGDRVEVIQAVGGG